MTSPDKKLSVAIFFGGKSAEHEVSLMSAKNVFEALDKTRFTPVLIGISKQGEWFLQDYTVFNDDKIKTDKSVQLAVLPGRRTLICANGRPPKIDVALPILHGPFGEDGTIQGLFELMNVPYAGPGVLSSAICMDKEVMKRLLQNASIATAAYLSFKIHQKNDILPDNIFKSLGQTVFVKPANMGSSVGVKKAQNATELDAAVNEAFKYDTKIIIESAIDGLEIECSVLGNVDPKASKVGQIIPRAGDFYSYEAKYLDENGAILQIPAKISSQIAQKAQDIAISTFQVLECEGMGRVDMFITTDNQFFVNEINTIPGFTTISMYPKLWEASGISYKDLITQIIGLAIKRHETKTKLLNTV